MTRAEDAYALQSQHNKYTASETEFGRLHESWLDLESLGSADGYRLGFELGAFFGRGNYAVMTIGDGRMGMDSVKLKHYGAKQVLPTDVSADMLELGKARGIIDSYSVENAERLSFADNAFDFTFCREAYHHLPRPWMGVYEMLRVARKGIVLVEPQDQEGTLYNGFKTLKDGAGKMIGDYEESGNYVYRLSLRELCKVALGLNLPMLAYKGTVSGYVDGIEFEPANSRSARAIRYWIKYGLRMLAWKIGIIRAPVLMAMLLKETLSDEERRHLGTLGWRFITFSRNPHLASA